MEEYYEKLLVVASDHRVVAINRALQSTVAIVGGSVRDAILGRPGFDIDLAAPLTPTEMTQRLEAAAIRVIPTGLAHQTVSALPDPDSSVVEITSFRTAGMTPEGGVRLGGSLEEDLSYRDFTINALAFDLSTGRLVDVGTGIEDLSAKVIRAVGRASERFAEDPLRIVRAVRFATQLGFEIEEDTWQAAKLVSPTAFSNVAIERIRDEFCKILLSPQPARGMRLLQQLGFFRQFIQELEQCVDFEQNRFHTADVFNHTLDVIERSSSDLVLRLAALFHDVGKVPTLSVDEDGDRHFFQHEVIGAEMTTEILKRLRFSKHIIEQVVLLVRTHMRPIEAGDAGLRRLLRDTGDLFPKWRQLKEADAGACKIDAGTLAERLTDFDKRMSIVQQGPKVSPLASLAVKGGDLLAIGLKAGPEIGEILRALHERVLDEPSLNQREILLEFAKEMAKK